MIRRVLAVIGKMLGVNGDSQTKQDSLGSSDDSLGNHSFAAVAHNATASLDELIGLLPETERMYVRIGLVTKEVPYYTPQVVSEASTFYRDKKAGADYLAKLALRNGNPDDAIRCFLNDGSDYAVLSAVKIAEDHIGFDRAIVILEEALQNMNKKDLFPRYYDQLSKYYARKGNIEKAETSFNAAITEYQKQGDFLSALKLAKEKDNKKLQLELLIEWAGKKRNTEEQYNQAARLAEQLKDGRTSQLYRKAFDAMIKDSTISILGATDMKLLTLAKRINTPEALIKAYVKLAQISYVSAETIDAYYTNAAAIAEKAGYNGIAVQLYRKARDPRKAIDLLIKKNKTYLAIRVAKKDIGEKEAAYLALNNQQPETALKLIEKTLAIDYVCRSYEDPDYFRIAIRAYDALDNQEQKQEYLKKGINRFSALGNFAVCSQFALLQGNTYAANTYDLLEKQVKKHSKNIK